MRFHLTIILVSVSFFAHSQKLNFDENKWKNNYSDSSCTNYRGCIEVKVVFDLVNGKSKKQIRKILGKPDFTRKDDYGNLYFIYSTDKLKKGKADKKPKSSISFLIKNGKVYDVVRVNVGG